MIYPHFLKDNSIIGVSALSDVFSSNTDLYRLNSAIKNMKKNNLDIVLDSYISNNVSPNEKASEFNKLIADKKIDMVICAKGGDFLLETLPYIDFDNIKENPKWIEGYSDPTGILFTVTTLLDIATIYGTNFSSFGMNHLYKDLENNISILKGNLMKEESFELYEDEFMERSIGDEGYNLTKEVIWSSNRNKVNIRGRIIGGCIDVIINLIGTKFDNINNFIERYKEDGIIWYFDNAELSSEDIIRSLWQFRNAGYFKYTKGIIFGRSLTNKSYYNISFKEAVLRGLGNIDIPVIFDADIGHKAPFITVINGALVNIYYENGKGYFLHELK